MGKKNTVNDNFLKFKVESQLKEDYLAFLKNGSITILLILLHRVPETIYMAQIKNKSKEYPAFMEFFPSSKINYPMQEKNRKSADPVTHPFN